VNNVIPTGQLDPVSLKVVSLIPQATNAGLTNNYLAPFTNPRLTYIPSVKIDHSLSAKTKISGYWSRTSTNTPNNNTLPALRRGQDLTFGEWSDFYLENFSRPPFRAQKTHEVNQRALTHREKNVREHQTR